MNDFITALEAAGWTRADPYLYRKGAWRLVFDTGHWIEVGTDTTPRIFDVPVPVPGLQRWCLSLIEHLCATDDKIRTLSHHS